MKTVTTKTVNAEQAAAAVNGWAMLAFNLLMLCAAIGFIIFTIVHAARTGQPAHLVYLNPSFVLLILAIVLFSGHFTLQPNEARVLILFGAYQGTVRASGFWWANPFYSRSRGRAPLNAAAGAGRNTVPDTTDPKAIPFCIGRCPPQFRCAPETLTATDLK